MEKNGASSKTAKKREKKRKNTDKASPLSSKKSKGNPTPPKHPSSSAFSFDKFKFKSRFNEDEYRDNFCKRPVVLERNLVLPTGFLDEDKDRSEKIDVCREINEAIQVRGWEELRNLKFQGYAELVTEFYANVSTIPGEYKSYVRGKKISFRPKTLNKLLNVPRVDKECRMNAFVTGVRVKPEDYDDVLCNGRAKWLASKKENVRVRSLISSSLSMKAKVWWAFVQGILLPILHKFSITACRLWCLKLLMQEEHINVGLTLANEIKTLYGQKKGSLSYAGIISQLCVNAGVSVDELEPMKRSKPIDLSWIFGNAPRVAKPRVEQVEKEMTSEDLIARSLYPPFKVIHNNIRRMFQQAKVHTLMAPIIMEIGMKVGVDVTSLSSSPLLTEESLKEMLQFDELPTEPEPEENVEEESENGESSGFEDIDNNFRFCKIGEKGERTELPKGCEGQTESPQSSPPKMETITQGVLNDPPLQPEVTTEKNPPPDSDHPSAAASLVSSTLQIINSTTNTINQC